MTQPSRLQQGFAAVAAIFLVVVLAALGAYMVAFSNAQQLSNAQDVLGTRAYWAARAGLEWGLAQGVANSACPAVTAPTSIEGFALTVTCTPSTYTDGTTVKILRFTSEAKMGTVGSVGYIERSVSATLER